MYSYGKRGENINQTGGFTRGLPSGQTIYIPAGAPAQAEAVISAQVGQRILVASTLIDEEDDGDLWYVVEYYLLGTDGKATGSLVTWRYQVSTGVHPSLEPKVKGEDAISPYYPIVPIRERTQRIKDADVELYTTGKHTLRTLGLDFDNLDKMVHDDGNIDLGDLEHAYVIIAADVASKLPNTNVYLYEHFSKLYSESGVKKEDFDYWNTITRFSGADLPPPPPMNRLEISDGKYKMVLGWAYITRTLKTGVVTKLNQVTKEFTFQAETEMRKKSDDSLLPQPAYVVDNSYLTMRKQVTATQYEELIIYGMVHTNYIGKQGRVIHTSLQQAFTKDTEDDKNNFIIPLRQDVVKYLGSIKGHDLMYDSVRIVFNSHGYNKLKWYQTGLFKVAIVIVAVAVSIINAPAGAALLSLAMSTIITTVVTLQFIEVGLKMVEDLVGPEFALAVAIVVAVFTGNFENVSGYINTATTAISGLNSIRTLKLLEEIEEEMTLLDDEIAELEAEEAIRAEDLLWTMNVLDDTSYLLTQPNNFLRNVRLASRAEVDLPAKTHLFVETMRFTDRPYSHIKLGLNPNQA